MRTQKFQTLSSVLLALAEGLGLPARGVHDGDLRRLKVFSSPEFVVEQELRPVR